MQSSWSLLAYTVTSGMGVTITIGSGQPHFYSKNKLQVQQQQ